MAFPGIAIPSSAILEVHNTGSGRQKCGCCWLTQSAATQSQRPEDQRKCYGMPYLCECSTARGQDLGSLGMPRSASQGCCCGCCSAPGNVDVPDQATLGKSVDVLVMVFTSKIVLLIAALPHSISHSTPLSPSRLRNTRVQTKTCSKARRNH
jgi:hypothetical protein